MSKKQKRLLIIGIAIIVVILIIMLVNSKKTKQPQNNIVNKNTEEYTQQNEDGNKVNTSEALKQPRNELEYYIKNITLQTQETQTILKLDIQNLKSTTLNGKLVDIVFVNKDGVEESRMALYIREIKQGETITTQATVQGDFTNVYNFKLVNR